MTYAEKLRNVKWQKLRLDAMEAVEWTCQMCHRKPDFLNVHHKKYKPGAKPWEYSLDELLVLCDECHLSIHIVKAAPPDPQPLTPIEHEIQDAIVSVKAAEDRGDWPAVHRLLWSGLDLIKRKLGISATAAA